MTREPAVEVRELVKRYPKSPANAVDGLSFAVERGEVFGLLGPNGAGKTTTVGVLTTRVLPTGGSARIAGLDVVADAVAVRSRLAVVPQRVNLDRSLSVRDNLVFHAAYHGVGRAERNRRADALLDRMGLRDKAKAMADDLSGGQSQRVMIARGLMHRPEVLFLDEPSTGLDPQARLFVHDQVRKLRDEGVTIVLTTHDMDEAQKLSDRVGIVDHGRLLALDTPAGLIRSLPGCGTVEVTVAPGSRPGDDLVARLFELPGVERVEQLAAATVSAPLPGGPQRVDGPGRIAAPPAPTAPGTDIRLRLYVDTEPAALVGPVVAQLSSLDAQVSDLSLGEPSLEDVFISLTGRDLR
ncbi:ABC transporter ATP-binding protein [Pseudonocardia hispaniensis]|uniref:ABC transporter ATP-binding protein n=1 Tax=Pseudonocardia hispaniensis TaxID=904933 RepID=A0ABW1J3X9_9PSEU